MPSENCSAEHRRREKCAIEGSVAPLVAASVKTAGGSLSVVDEATAGGRAFAHSDRRQGLLRASGGSEEDHASSTLEAGSCDHLLNRNVAGRRFMLEFWRCWMCEEREPFDD